MNIKKILSALFLCKILFLSAQSLQHPVIWTTSADKAMILDHIENYSWANSVVTKAKNAIETRVNVHINNPETILNTIPALASDDNLSEAQATTNGAHATVLNYASYAGMMYHVTGEEKYAQFAADILWYYIEELSTRSPSNTTICGNDFYDPRASYAQFAIAYDFVVNYLKTSGTQVYQKSTGSKIPFNNTKAQKAVYNIAMNALHEHGGTDTKYGKTVSNHPILRAPGVLFSILCVEDDAARERMFNVFWNVGTKEQNSFTKTILPMFGEQGIWPEALSYSFMQNITLVLNVVDRLKPELNVLNNNLNILDGNFLFDNLRHPNRRFVRYGDSHRDNDGTAASYRYTLNLATRRGLDAYAQKAKVALRQSYDADGGYNPFAPISTFDNYLAFEQLFWGLDIPETIDTQINFQKPTVVIKHAGIALQRNYTTPENNENYGLSGIIGGAHYVHSHATGITMELYGAGYIMAANAGLPKTLAERKLPEHEDYFWRHAGNNTMIVNGTTHGIQNGAWNTDSDLWMNTTINVASEPKHLEDPVSTNFSFATQFLDDKVNNDQQQRTLSTIRTSETSGYYFDMFRSKSLGTNNFHDYIYHNIGDATYFLDKNGEEVNVTATTRYQTDIGDAHQSPGWRFFEETKTTTSINEAVTIRFDINFDNRYMYLFSPGGVGREFTKALGPATREAKNGYVNKKTQVLAIRQQGEAWKRPYVQVFEPTISENSTVKSVENLFRGDVTVGLKVTSEVNGKEIIDYVISQEDATNTFHLPEVNLSFTGRFAVVRKEQDREKAQLTLYIGEGESLSFGTYTLQGGEDKKAQLVTEIDVDRSRMLYFENIEDGMELIKGTNLAINAYAGSDFTEVSLWANETTNLGTLTAAPYTWASHPILTNMTDASYAFKLVAKDANGAIVEKSISVAIATQWAYTDEGKPNEIPGLIQFENYDNGGYGVAYFDRTSTNSSSFRSNERVDLSSDGTKITGILPFEWLEYTINVALEGNYDVEVSHQTRKSPAYKQLTVTLPDESITLLSDVVLTNTGSESFMVENIGSVFLEKGKHVLRFLVLDTDFDLDYFELKSKSLGVEQVVKVGLDIMKIYPNPARNSITIQTGGVVWKNVSIFNMLGVQVYTNNSGKEKLELSVKEHKMKSGVYFVQISNEEGERNVKKLIVK